MSLLDIEPPRERALPEATLVPPPHTGVPDEVGQPFRGIAIASLISIPLWALIIVGVRTLITHV